MKTPHSTRALLLKSCARCQGDLIIDSDDGLFRAGGDERQFICLQCGRRSSFNLADVSGRPVMASRRAVEVDQP